MFDQHQTLKLLSKYWSSADKNYGYGLAAGILCLGFTETWLLVQYNNWYGNFFNSLQQRKAAEFWAAIPFLFVLLAAPMISQVVKEFLDSWLHVRWRLSTTDYVIGRWLSKKAFYRVERDSKGDNPDQRIAEDVSLLVQITMNLTLRFATTLVSLFSFGYLTWTKGGDLDVTFLGYSFHVYGYMFWVAVFYAAFDCLVTHLSGRKLFAINIGKEAAEAEFRYSLMQVRENSEQIAMYHGERVEQLRLLKRFGDIWQVCKKLFVANAKVNFTTGTSNRVMAILPLLLMAPNLLSGNTDLGSMMAATTAWMATALGLAWFAKNYTEISQ